VRGFALGRKGDRRVTPRKAKAQGSSRPRLELNTPAGRKGLSGGAKPRGRAGRMQLAGSAPSARAVANDVWVSAAETLWHRRGGEGSEGRNPRSAADLKTAGWGRRGENRREGTQTLRAEGDGLAKPVCTGSGGPACAEGDESSGELSASRVRKSL